MGFPGRRLSRNLGRGVLEVASGGSGAARVCQGQLGVCGRPQFWPPRGAARGPPMWLGGPWRQPPANLETPGPEGACTYKKKGDADGGNDAKHGREMWFLSSRRAGAMRQGRVEQSDRAVSRLLRRHRWGPLWPPRPLLAHRAASAGAWGRRGQVLEKRFRFLWLWVYGLRFRVYGAWPQGSGFRLRPLSRVAARWCVAALTRLPHV